MSIFKKLNKIYQEMYPLYLKCNNQYSELYETRPPGKVYVRGQNLFKGFSKHFFRWNDSMCKSKKPVHISIRINFSEGYSEIKNAVQYKNLLQVEKAKKHFQYVIDNSAAAKTNIIKRKINKESFYLNEELDLMDLCRENAKLAMELIEKGENSK